MVDLIVPHHWSLLITITLGDYRSTHHSVPDYDLMAIFTFLHFDLNPSYHKTIYCTSVWVIEMSSCNVFISSLSTVICRSVAQTNVAIFLVQARRSFRTLKGIIRLQALIRGHLVRRQAVSTLRTTWLIVKFQALVRGRNVRLSGAHMQFIVKFGQRNFGVSFFVEHKFTFCLHHQSSFKSVWCLLHMVLCNIAV